MELFEGVECLVESESGCQCREETREEPVPACCGPHSRKQMLYVHAGCLSSATVHPHSAKRWWSQPLQRDSAERELSDCHWVGQSHTQDMLMETRRKRGHHDTTHGWTQRPL